MHNIIDEIKRLQDSLDGIETALKLYERKKKDLEDALACREKVCYDVYSFKVVKRILSYIAQGVEEDRAIFLTYDDLSGSLRMKDIETIWLLARAQKKGLIMYGRVFTAKTMRKAGFTLSEIANTLNLSPASVRKLISSNCLM